MTSHNQSDLLSNTSHLQQHNEIISVPLDRPEKYKAWDNRLLGDIKRSIDASLRGIWKNKTLESQNVPLHRNVESIYSPIKQKSYESSAPNSSTLRIFEEQPKKRAPFHLIHALDNQEKEYEENKIQDYPTIEVNEVETNGQKEGVFEAKSAMIDGQNMKFLKRNDSNDFSAHPTMASTIIHDEHHEYAEPRKTSGYGNLSNYPQDTFNDLGEGENKDEEITRLRKETAAKDKQIQNLLALVKKMEGNFAKLMEFRERENRMMDSIRMSLTEEVEQITSQNTL